LSQIVRNRRVRERSQEERADPWCHQLEQPPESRTIAFSVQSHQLLFRGVSGQPVLKYVQIDEDVTPRSFPEKRRGLMVESTLQTDELPTNWD
jgi:hypothetical protein